MHIIKKVISLSLSVCTAVCIASCGTVKNGGNASNKITWWITNSTQIVDSYDKINAFKEAQRKLGVDIEFIHPAEGQESEQFNVMSASRDLKDVVSYDWKAYNGGAVKAAQDGVIIKLDDYIEKCMPNFSKLMKENPDVKRLAQSYNGSIYVIPCFSDDIMTNAVFGPQIRKDWLDKLGLSVPETIEDWHRVLKAFKEKDPNGNGKADEIPFATGGEATFMRFSRAYDGIEDDFCINKDGEIVFGFIEPEFKEFLIEMNKWYKEGLISSEYVAEDPSIADTEMMTDLSGAFIGYSGSAMARYNTTGRESNPDYEVIGVQWPTHNGGKPFCGYPYMKSIGTPEKGMALSTSNKNIEKTLEFIDYFYGDEGAMLMNWGVEGETYEKDGNTYKFTDTIMHNSEGKTPIEAITQYGLTQFPATMLRSDAFMELNTALDEQKGAMETWRQADVSRILPAMTFSPEEQKEITKVMDDIYMYRNEWMHKLVMGVEPIDKWDEISAKIKKMGIEKAIAAYQSAYDRYMN